MLESETHPIREEKISDALVIRFIRPNARNPLSVATLQFLDRIIGIESKNADFVKIIFTGAADVFASGADLREIAATTKEKAWEFALRGQNLMRKIENAPQMTIAAVNGFCFGGALDLALACNVRIASPKAVFCHAGANLGIITGWGGTQRLPRLIGEAAALEMFLTAKKVSADEALRIGLIDKISAQPLTDALKTSSSVKLN